MQLFVVSIRREMTASVIHDDRLGAASGVLGRNGVDDQKLENFTPQAWVNVLRTVRSFGKESVFCQYNELFLYEDFTIT